MEITKQELIKIAYLGPENTFSHIAAEKNSSYLKFDKVEFLSCGKMEEVIGAVKNNEAKYGLAPYWNTSKHRIITAQVGLIQAEELRVVDNFKMDINLCLVSQSSDISGIKEIHTIPHVVEQFSIYQSKKLKDIIFKEVESTVRGIEKALDDPSIAAVCSHRAAAKHQPQMKIIDKDIQNPNNATLFFLFQKSPSFEREQSEYYTLLACPLVRQFKTRVEILDILMEDLIFMTHDWSIDVNGQKWTFIEVAGHIKDLPIRELIDELKELAPETRIIGCYETRIERLWDSRSRFDSY